MPRDDTVIHSSCVPLSTARILNIMKAQTNSFSISISTPQITKKERKSALQTTNGKKRERRKRRRTVLLLLLLRMSLWTLLQSVLLVANAFAVLNEERFLEPKSLSQSAITSGYVSAHGFKGQLIGLIYAASYLRMPLLAANAIVIFVKVLFG